MRHLRTFLSIVILAVCFAPRAWADDICAICGKPIYGTVYLVTDEVTGEKQMVCSDCVKLPRCYVCGLPVKDNGIDLPDGRHLCARDGKTAVLDAGDASRIAGGVREDLDRLFSRFTSFPTNVDVTVLDRIDVDKMFQPDGNDFESPNLLGCIVARTNASQVRYAMRLLSGLPQVELKATAAHEFSHAWVGENVPPERHARLSHDAEEGFCELVAFRLMDSQNEETQKKFILKNRYTRGQVDLFVAADRNYGFQQILDWMRYGETSELEGSNLEKVREVNVPSPGFIAANPSMAMNHPLASTNINATVSVRAAVSAPATIHLQGILWGNNPMAIINGRSFSANDKFSVKVGTNNIALRCLAIERNSVRIQHVDSGREEVLQLAAH